MIYAYRLIFYFGWLKCDHIKYFNTYYLHWTNKLGKPISYCWIYCVFCDVSSDPKVVIVSSTRTKWSSLWLHLVCSLPSSAYHLVERDFNSSKTWIIEKSWQLKALLTKRVFNKITQIILNPMWISITSPIRPIAWESEDMMLIAPISCNMSSAAIVSALILDSAKATSSGMSLCRWWQTICNYSKQLRMTHSYTLYHYWHFPFIPACQDVHL